MKIYGTRNDKKTMILSAGGGVPSNTGGCETPAADVIGSSYPKTIMSAEFKNAADSSLEWLVVMPDEWNGGTVTARFYGYGETSEATNNDVVFALKAVGFEDSDTLDVDWGTQQTGQIDVVTANDMCISSDSSAITIGGTGLAGGSAISFKCTRDVDGGTNDYAHSAFLVHILIEYTTDSWES